MKKKMIMVFIITLLTSVLATQVFAVTILDTGIVGLIKEGVSSIKGYYVAMTTQEMNELASDEKMDIGQYVEQKNNQVNSELQQHLDKEIERAASELNTYSDTLKQEAGVIIDNNVKVTKTDITKVIDEGITSAKEGLQKELEKEIKNILKK